jgi:excisionase family DNA binding protein
VALTEGEPRATGTATVQPMPDNEPPEWLTQAEAAALLRITTKMLRAETKAGRVPAVKFGRTVRYRRATLLNLDRADPDHPGPDTP